MPWAGSWRRLITHQLGLPPSSGPHHGSRGAASADLGRGWRRLLHPCRGGDAEVPSDQGRGRTTGPPPPTHYPFSALHVRALRNRPVSLCPFLRLLGRFCSIFCIWSSAFPPPPPPPGLHSTPAATTSFLHLLCFQMILPITPHFQASLRSLLGLQVLCPGAGTFHLQVSPHLRLAGRYQQLCAQRALPLFGAV